MEKLEIPVKSGLCKNCFRFRRLGSSYCGQCQGEPPMKAYIDDQKNFPLLEKVVSKFNISDKKLEDIVFTYGDIIYTRQPLSYGLITHETTHIMQQAKNKDEWWGRYLIDDDFRLEQEIEAYQRQLQAYKNNDIGLYEVMLPKIAKDLNSGMYGDIFTSIANLYLNLTAD